MGAIVTNLSSSLITPLTLTWKCISSKVRDSLLEMEKIFNPSRNFTAYRRAFDQTTGPRIPLLSMSFL